MKLLSQVAGTEFIAWVDSVGQVDCPAIDAGSLTHEAVEASPVRCPDATASAKMETEILDAKKNGDSVGGTVKLIVRNVPAALGEPVFDRLDALLAQAMLSIPACKGFEIGSGFAAARMRGSEHNDEIYFEDGKFRTRTNNAGGSVGGISNGADIECRLAFKPTATISQSQKTASREPGPEPDGFHRNGTSAAAERLRRDSCGGARARRPLPAAKAQLPRIGIPVDTLALLRKAAV